ncbi:uncharacterized protein TNCV_4639631 [Trichonephila clavipes]|nr:uncharacterized protein TNCV_4639631 [Trichonephila clavipes]
MLSSRPGAIYRQDNAPPDSSRLSQQCLQGYDVHPWPARSPDLSASLRRAGKSIASTRELIAQLQRFWHDLPWEVKGDLIDSMPRRNSTCIASCQRWTHYLLICKFFKSYLLNQIICSSAFVIIYLSPHILHTCRVS